VEQADGRILCSAHAVVLYFNAFEVRTPALFLRWKSTFEILLSNKNPMWDATTEIHFVAKLHLKSEDLRPAKKGPLWSMKKNEKKRPNTHSHDKARGPSSFTKINHATFQTIPLQKKNQKKKSPRVSRQIHISLPSPAHRSH